MSEVTRLLLVRHGQTAWTRERRLQGQTDIPLNEAGRVQAAALRPYLRAFAPSRLLVSPARRASQTAELLCGLEPVYDARLEEAHLGEWEGLTPDQIGADYLSWRAGRALPPGAEPREDVVARVRAVLEAAVAEPGDILTVTHGGIIRAALQILVGLGAHQIVPVAAGSLTVFDVADGNLSSAQLRHYNIAPGAPDPAPCACHTAADHTYAHGRGSGQQQ